MLKSNLINIVILIASLFCLVAQTTYANDKFSFADEKELGGTLGVNAAEYPTACFGAQLTIGGNPTAFGGTQPYNYSWSDGLANTANPIITATNTQMYFVTVTDADNCTATGSYQVNVHDELGINMDPDTEICLGESITINAPAWGGSEPYSYFWSSGQTTQSITVFPSTDTQYYVTVTDDDNCGVMDSITISVNGLTYGDTGPDVSVCLNDSVQIQAFNGTDYLWNTGQTGDIINVSPSMDSYYYVTITDGDACPYFDSIFVSVLPLPTAYAGEDQTVCLYETVTLFATGGESYIWSNNEVSQQIEVFIYSDSVFTVTVTDENFCTAQDDVMITALSVPSVELGEDVVICAGSCTTITPITTDADSYLWSTGETTESITVCINVDTIIRYRLTVFDINGCSSFDEIDVIVAPNLTAQISPDQTICENECTTLSASGGNVFEWSTGETSSEITVCPTTNTTYSVTVSSTEIAACPDTVEVNVFVNPMPNANAGTDQTICPNTCADLVATGGQSYLWSTGEQTPNITVCPANTSTYSVTVIDNNACTDVDEVTITVDQSLVVDAGPVKAVCYGDGVQIGGSPTASGGVAPYTFNWDNGIGTSANPFVSPLTTTTYNVTVTDDTGCTGVDDVTVIVGSEIIAETDPDNAICQGENIIINVTATGGAGAFSYLWSTNETAASITVSPTTNTFYYVTVTDANNCIDIDSILITVNSVPIADAGPDTSICFGNCVNLSGTGGQQYLWSTGETNPNISVCPTQSTMYYLTVTDALACTDIDSVFVEVYPEVFVDLGIDQEICPGSSITLIPNTTGGEAPFNFLWNDGSTLDELTISPTSSSSFDVTVTDANGCTDFDDIIVTISDSMTVDLGADIELCLGNNVELSASVPSGQTPLDYLWSTGETTMTITVGPQQNTNYGVTITDNNGCVGVDEIMVNVFDNPEIILTGDNLICNGTYAIINAEVSNGIAPYTYNWNNGETLSEITVSPTSNSTYALTVIDNKGCSDIASFTVEVIDTIEVTLGLAQSICIGEELSLTAESTSPADTYLWSTGETTQTIFVSPSNSIVYSVTVTSESLCDGSASQLVNVFPPVYVDAGLDQSINLGASAELNAVGSEGTLPYSYEWSTGEISNLISVSPIVTTNYSITITDRNGCQNIDDVTVFVDEIPAFDVSLPAEEYICLGSSLVLRPEITGGEPPFTYEWSTGEETPQITVSPIATTSYSVTVYDSNGASVSTSIEVIVYPKVTVDLGPDQLIPTGTTITIASSVAGGSGPFNYLWSTNETTSSISVSPTSTTQYSLTITDANLCITTDTITILIESNQELTASMEPLYEVCIGSSIILQANVMGGSTPYTFLWSNNSTSSSIEVNPNVATTYSVTVTDATGDFKVASTMVNPIPAPSVFAGADEFICQGETVNLTASSFNIGTISWAPNLGGNPITVSPSSTSSYIAQIVAPNNCVAYDTVIVFVTPQIVIDSALTICQGNSVLFNNQLINESGIYLDTIIWSGTCDTFLRFDLSVFDEDLVADISSEINCNSDLVDINIELIDDFGALEYTIDNGETWLPELTQLPLDDIDVCVRAIESQCIFCFAESIDPTLYQSSVAITVSSINPESCSSLDGSIEIFVEDGITVKSYSIDGGMNWQSLSIFENLGQGIYNIAVELISGCIEYYEVPVLLHSDESLIIEDVLFQGPEFCGEENGFIQIIVNNGEDATYSIDGINYFNNPVFEKLPSGIYNIYVVDQSTGCESYFPNITLEDGPTTFTVDNVIETLPSNCNASDGSIKIEMLNSNPNLLYSIDGGANWQASANFLSLPGGNYEIVVFDTTNQCQYNYPDEINWTLGQNYIVDIDQIINPDCVGGANGSIHLVTSGNDAGLVYNWSVPSFGTSSIFGLTAGNYFVTITDPSGCSQIQSYAVLDPPAFEPNIFGAMDSTICFGGSISFIQDNDDWLHRWRTSFGTQSFEEIFYASQPATYYIDVIDDNACMGIDSIQIEYGTESITAEFLMPTLGLVNEIQNAVEISWPIPDSIAWHFDSSKIELLGNDLNAYSFEFDETGIYTIGLEIFKAGCSDYVEHEIKIRSILDPITPQVIMPGIITDWNLFPNPTSGNFSLNVSLSSIAELQIRIYDEFGNLEDSSIQAADDGHTVLFNLTQSLPGTYYAVLIVNNNSVVVPFVKI